MSWPKWKEENYIVSWIKRYKCPCCDNGTFEFIKTDQTGILVNVESKGRIEIEDFWIPSRVCNNPICRWSKVKVESMNLSSVKEAWEESDKE